MSQDIAKNAAGLKAIEYVRDGMILGLGTGTTFGYFLQHLIGKCRNGLKIMAVATSTATETLARKGGIPLLDVNTLTTLDLTVDGADEIDPKKRLIKGAGGALVREKIIATMSKEVIIIADETKCVKKLGKHPLPLEVIPFGIAATKKHWENQGYKTSWRKNKDGTFYLTDNHNWILDITFPTTLDEPEKVHLELLNYPGVVGTGFFFNLATCIIIGKNDGSVHVEL